MYPESYFHWLLYYVTHERIKQKKMRFPRFDKILVIQPIAEVYGEGNERQLCLEIVVHLQRRIDIT